MQQTPQMFCKEIWKLRRESSTPMQRKETRIPSIVNTSCNMNHPVCQRLRKVTTIDEP